MIVRFGVTASRRHSMRAFALVGSALGSTLVIQPAAAQNQTITGPTPYQNTGTLSGGPTTVTATTSTGDINLDLNTVTAAVTGSGTAAPGANAAISATNSGPGLITIKDVNANITGTGAATGIIASAQGGGAISITQTGVVDATNAVNSRGITVATNGGAITINANEADGGLRGIYTGSVANGAFPSIVNITVNTAQSTGAANQPNAIIAQGDQVTLTSGTASLTNTASTNGTAILVNAGTSATVTSGAANALGQGQAGILAAADGTLSLTSGTVHATQNSDGISIQGSTPVAGSPSRVITVNSGTVLLDGANSGDGIVLGASHGGNFSSGTDGLVYTSAAVTSGTITTAGTNSYAIEATPNGTGTTTITSNNITTTGVGSYGIYEHAIGNGAISGASTITSTGALSTSGANANGVQVNGNTGAVTIANSGSIATSGANALGINVSNGTGAIAINSTGTVATTTDGSTGINAGGAGAITIAAADVRTAGANAVAINVAPSNGSTAAVTVQAGTIRTTGATSVGINAGNTSATGPVTVGVVNAITTGGAVNATSGGAVSITAGTVRVAGGTATGLNAISTGAGVTVNSTDLGVINGRAIFAQGATGAVVTSGTLTETGVLAQSNGYSDYALIAQVATPAQGSTIVPTGVTVNSTTLTSGSGGIRTSSLTGSTMINSGSVTAGGPDTAAISALATTGNVTVTSNSASASGNGSNAVYVSTTTGNILINSTTASTTGGFDANLGNSPDAVVAFNTRTGPGTITINSGTATAAGDYASAVFASGGGAITINSGTASGAGIMTDLVGANSGTSDVSITAGTTTATGANRAYAINGTAAAGNVTIGAGTTSAVNGIAVNASAGRVATVTATVANAGGDGYNAVNAVGGTGVVLNVGSASSTGATTTTTTNGTTTTRRGDAIYAQATTGTVNATIGSAKATGQGADAVRLIANGAGGAVTAMITGTLSSTSGYGLYIDPPGANSVTIAPGASITGATGVNLTGSSNTIANAGSITGTAGPGILATGATALDNRGAIAGSGGVAVQLGASNDTVTLRTGSAITGTIAGGGGTDTATLIGTSNASTGTQQVAALTGFSTLTVQSGYWAAPAANSTALNTATINGGATLEVANGAAGLTGLTAPSFVDNGLLVVRGTSASAGSTFGSSVVTGSGNVLLSGGLVTLDRLNSLQNGGTTTIDTGTNVLLTGTQGGTFVNNGNLLIGNGGTTGTFTGNVADNGTLTLNRSDSYTFTGALSGSGTFVKQGTGQVVFGANYAFTGTTVLNGGSIKLSTPVAATTRLDAEGTGTYDLSGNAQTIAQLQGASTGAIINIANGSLTVNQDGTTSFAGSITGNGSLTKTGSGSLNLTGANTYTGPTTINAGRLAVNGSITSPVTVNAGGTLGGNGTVGNTAIGSGGTFAPGNSIGTTNVAGNVTFAAGSIYQVEANAAGMADRINVSGTATINGGTVQVLAAPGTYNPITNYTILTAAGGVSGTFSNATSSLAFLSPILNYTTNAVTLSLLRNDIAFASQAVSPNGAAVATAIQARGFGDPIYNAILVQTGATAGAAFNQLSGEIHATIPMVMIDSDRRVRDAILDRARTAQGDGLGVWLQSMDTRAHARNQGAVANARTDRIGMYGGADYVIAGFRVGVSGGYFDDKLRDPNVFSRAEIGTEIIGGSIGYVALDSRLTVDAGVTHGWHHADTTRVVTAVATLAGTYLSRSTLQTTQVFGEAAYQLLAGPIALTPFVTIDRDWSRADAFVESGGIAALGVAGDRRHLTTGSAGARVAASYPIGASSWLLQPHLSLAYLRNWGNLGAQRTETFGGTGPSFTVTGDRLGRDNLDASGGIDLLAGANVRIGVSGYTTRSSQWRDYGGKASVGLRF